MDGFANNVAAFFSNGAPAATTTTTNTSASTSNNNNAFAPAHAMVILYLVLVVTSMALAVLLCINDRAPRSNLGEMPRSIFATIVPQNCNMNLGRALYGNETKLYWGGSGWNLYSLIGVCPTAGITFTPFDAVGAKLSVGTYRGCIDFTNAQLWAQFDAQNQAAGQTTALAAAAAAQVGTHRYILYAGTAFLWFGGLTGIVLPSVCYASWPSLRDRLLFTLATFTLPMLVALALFAQALRMLVTSDLMNPAAYTNNLFRSCQVTITYTGSDTYKNHTTVIGLLVVFAFLFPYLMARYFPEVQNDTAGNAPVADTDTDGDVHVAATADGPVPTGVLHQMQPVAGSPRDYAPAVGGLAKARVPRDDAYGGTVELRRPWNNTNGGDNGNDDDDGDDGDDDGFAAKASDARRPASVAL